MLFNEILHEFLTFIVATIAAIDKLFDNIVLPFVIKIDEVFFDGR